MKIQHLLYCFVFSLTFSACDLFFETIENDPTITDPANNNGGWSSGDDDNGWGSDDNRVSPALLPDFYPTQLLGKELIEHKHYRAAYSSRHRNAEWTAYTLTANDIRNSFVERRSGFLSDPANSSEPSHSDYTNSGYDRGHLVPAHDMSFSEQAMEESFYMTNVSPQDPDFNRGIWKSLEHRVNQWAEEEGRVYVITGPILPKRISSKAEKIGEAKDIIVPKNFYKVVLVYEQGVKKAIGFAMPNKEGEGPLSRYARSVDEIEEFTGLDFFPAMPDNEENSLESTFDVNAWSGLLD